MASNITQEIKDYLADASKVRLAHLVAIELPGGLGAFAYYTDYFRDIVYEGQTYSTGKLKSITDVKQTFELSAYTLSVKITGAEQSELDKAMASQSYLNKKITIHRVYLDENGDHVPYYVGGTTLKYFEGSITEVSVDENSSAISRGSSTITWKCANEFYELERVNGRLTDDASHRGIVIDGSGNEIPSTAAKKIAYQDDLGFFHANKSINILAEYQSQEKAYKMVEHDKGLFGWRKEYEMVEYWETVTREVDMRFNLAAKYIPAVYGVQKIDGIPVFADTLVDDPTKVYVVYAFAEGEIDGFLDFYMDDKPMVCFDNTDIDERACVGVKRGQGNTISVATPSQGPSDPSVHGQEYVLNDGNGLTSFWTFHGKPDQSAASVLVNLAAQGKFYLQNYGESTAGPEYWDSRYKLLDTAYVVAVYEITEERSNIPTLSAEVQGCKVPVYNSGGLVSDNKTSLNFAWQYLDYLTSEIYGAGVSLDRVDLDSFIEVASFMDAQDTSYSASWLPFWRYVGWEDDSSSRRAVMQGNPVLDTSSTVFKNMDTLLKQGICSLNIVEGLYTLTVEAEKPPVAHIEQGDIVTGKIAVTDITSKEKYNSVIASIVDPGLGWQKNDITFYDQGYKIEDENVERKASLSFPFITNYYTARSLAERELRKSRYNREVTLTLPYKYLDLPINSPITISYPRFGWVEKEFLLREVTWKSDGKVQVKAREYTDGIFINSPQADKGDDQVPIIGSKVKPPRNFNYVPSISGVDPIGVNGNLRWYPSYTTDVTYYALRISGNVNTIAIPVSGTLDPNTYLNYAVSGLAAGNYTFELRAVAGARGLVSSPVVIVVDVDPAVNLSAVEDFDLTNNIPGDESVWQGSDIATTWSPITEEAEGLIAGIGYELEFLDGVDLVHGYNILNQYDFTYLYTTNKADYAIHNSGDVGVYRQLDVRIRAYGPDGEQSVAWTYL